MLFSAPALVAQAPSAPERERLFAELADDVAAFERHGSILKRVVRLITPSVVHIEAARYEPPGSVSRETTEEAGSGIIVALQDRHFIVTNRHVVKDSRLEGIKIKLADGRLVYPRKVWSDRGTDLAVMALPALDDLLPARLGDSDQLEIGDYVLAVGSPFGLSHSVTYGIISAKGRRDLQLGDDGVRFQDFLQTDAAINPGNSGGPLVNLRGEVIGINTAIASSSGGSEGIGFTIPVNMAMTVCRQLIERGSVTRAFLGVHLDSRFTPEAAARLGLPRYEGARVSGITPESPAEKAALRVGDVILRYNEARIEDDGHLINLVSVTPVAEEVPLLIYREGRPLTVRVRVGDRGIFEPE
jgi:serine protease Do